MKYSDCLAMLERIEKIALNGTPFGPANVTDLPSTELCQYDTVVCLVFCVLPHPNDEDYVLMDLETVLEKMSTWPDDMTGRNRCYLLNVSQFNMSLFLSQIVTCEDECVIAQGEDGLTYTQQFPTAPRTRYHCNKGFKWQMRWEEGVEDEVYDLEYALYCILSHEIGYRELLPSIIQALMHHVNSTENQERLFASQCYRLHQILRELK